MIQLRDITGICYFTSTHVFSMNIENMFTSIQRY